MAFGNKNDQVDETSLNTIAVAAAGGVVLVQGKGKSE